MNQDNFVIFKGTKEGITIYLDEMAEISVLRDILNKKMEDSSKFFKGAKTNILFKGKALTEEEEIEFVKIISEKADMTITFVQSDPKNEIHTLLGEKLQQHNLSKFYKGNIRSGQILEFEGSIVIIGDVNPGAVVRSNGNIIILGSLKGVAHAGASGMTDAFIAALTMVPVQLRIADMITRFPDTKDGKTKKTAEYAYIKDGQIYVVPLE